MTPYLKMLAEGKTLTRPQAADAMRLIMSGETEPEELAAFLLGLRSRGETADELTGFTETMRSFAVPVQLDDPHAIDIVGTGGDASGTFNISTTTAFVCAGTGICVAKHGNRAVSSKSGAADVLSACGVYTDLEKAGVEECLSKAGISFIFAPFFHPAMKNVMPVRRKLKVRTFFNILGPLCNPAGVQRMLVGAFSDEVARQMAEILQKLGVDHALTVHGSDGMDECTLTGPTFTHRIRKEAEDIKHGSVSPESFGFSPVEPHVLRGGDAAENAQTMKSILSGVHGPERDVVVLNAALALQVSGKYPRIDDALEAAHASIDSGAAAQKLEALAEVSNEAASGQKQQS